MWIGWIASICLEAILIVNYNFYLDTKWYKKVIITIFEIIAYSIFSFLVSVLINCFIEFPFHRKMERYEVYEEGYEIYSLDQNTNSDEIFILGENKYVGSMKEYFYMRNSDNGLILDSIRDNYLRASNDICIEKSDEETPKVKYVYEISRFPEKYEKWFGTGSLKSKKKTIIVIPKNATIAAY